MKKWLAILLIMITAAGSFIPCCAVDDCCADQNSSSSSHDEHQNEGVCSPFFACATCPVSVEVAKAILLTSPVKEKIVHHEVTINFRPSNYSASFWQPPRSC